MTNEFPPDVMDKGNTGRLKNGSDPTVKPGAENRGMHSGPVDSNPTSKDFTGQPKLRPDMPNMPDIVKALARLFGKR